MQEKPPTTLEEIEALESDTLRPIDVAAYLHTGQSTISNAAKLGVLPWAYKLGTRTVIPKLAFIHYHRYGQIMPDRIPAILREYKGESV